MKKAFTLIELLLVIVIFGILSMLLFRTMGEMIRTNARVQQEKILATELINIQTTVNNIAEQYPYINREQYQDLPNSARWFVSELHLTNWSGETLTLQWTWDCAVSWCSLQALINNTESIKLTNSNLTKISNITFKLLPTQYYTGTQYTSNNFTISTISAPWFWIFGTLTNHLKNNAPNKVSYTLQHFINLQEPEEKENQSSNNTQQTGP